MSAPLPLTPVERPTNVRYWVLGGFCVAAAIAYIQRYAINQLAPDIGREMYLNKEQMGDVMSSFFAAYALASLPAAYLADRWGSRRALACYAVLWSTATALMCGTWDRESMIVVWGLAGAAQAGLFPAAMIGLRDWLPSTRRAVGSGMLAMFMNVGAALSPLIAAGLSAHFHDSWRDTFAWLALPGIAWAAWYVWWYRDRPEEHPAVNGSELILIRDIPVQTSASTSISEPIPWVQLATSFRMWLICAQQFLRAAAQVIFGTWFATLLKENPTIAEQHAPWLTSVPPVMLIIGSFCGGIIADWLLWRTGSRRVSRQWLAVVSLTVCAVMLLLATLTDSGYQQVSLVAVACLFMATGGVGSYTVTLDLGGRHVATVFSTMNMFGSFGAACFPKYAGWLVDTTGSWNAVLLSMSAIYVAAALCWALLDPTGTLLSDRSEEAKLTTA